MSTDRKLKNLENEVRREVQQSSRQGRGATGGRTRILVPVIAFAIVVVLAIACKVTGVIGSQDSPQPGTTQSSSSFHLTDGSPDEANAVADDTGEFDPDAVLADVFDEADYETLPAYDGDGTVELNGNVPEFSDDQLIDDSFECYSDLDILGRCGPAVASLSEDTMPEPGEQRGSIREVHPTGWHQNMYDFVDQEALYNRSHLIAWSLSAENANAENLITGTRYMNYDCMRPYEESVVDYIHRTGNHVMYRVTPVFVGAELVARGVVVEAYSVEDDGEGICFNVFCYNVQPGVFIDYETGYNRAA